MGSSLVRAGLLALQLVAGVAGSRLALGGTGRGLPSGLSRLPSASARLRGGLSRALCSLSAALAPPESGGAPSPQGGRAHSEAAFADALALHARFTACECPRLGPPLRAALGVLADALRLYGPSGVLGSFNGGKDAVVIFHLLRAAVAEHQRNVAADARVCPQLIYFHHPREFAEVEAFVARAVAHADAELVTYEGGIVDGLRTHIARELAAGRPSNFAFCLGTRQGDPNCKGQTAFAPSSAWMPPFMRVNPILDWDYGLVWQLLVGYELEYCALYDQGYTSLGTRDDTAPNPALLLPSGGGYLPAYALADYALERAGRQPSKPKDAAAKGTRAAGADCGASAAPAPPASAPAPSAALPGGRSPVESARTAGLVVIGDELLKGKVADTNAPHAIRAMRGKGLDVRRVALVRDELDEIAREVRAQSQALDLVVTSGGVGPTHDDVTLRAVAAAFDRPIERNEEMAEMIRRAYGGAPLSPAREKMALLPAGVRLRLPPPSESGEPSLWPIVQVENVFILPGVPDFFEAKLATILGHFVGDSRPAVHTRKLALSCAEDDIVRPLNEVVGAYGGLAFGSYPVSADECRTVVTIEGTDEAEVEAALLALTSKLSPDTIVRTPSKSLEQMLN